MKHLIIAFAVVGEIVSTGVIPCPGAVVSINTSTVTNRSVQYLNACIEVFRQAEISKAFDTRKEAEKYLKKNQSKYPNGKIVEVNK